MAEHESVGSNSPLALFIYHLVRLAAAGACTVYARVQVRGRENVPKQGAYVVAPVHRSGVDFMFASLVPSSRRTRYLIKDSIWKIKPLGKFLTYMGGFPVSRGTADRDALHTCIGVLQGGDPLVMFPEGQRRSGAVVEDLYDGPAYVAAKVGVPIVPVGIGGSTAMMPKGSKFIRPGKVVVMIGEPIYPPPATEGSRSTSRHAVRAMTEELQVAVQKLYSEAEAASEAR
jgi:1-acyl-sn-glycerol-3-phosphate acyltransferase